MDDIRFEPADTIAPARLHEAFGAAFSDYLIGPFGLPLAQWPVFLGRQAVDLALSRIALRGDRILAFAFTAPRPAHRVWRLATMGAVPGSRGSGAAPALLDDFIVRAAAAGQQAVELECFAQNERAVRLYRGRGFEPLHELHGYARDAGAPVPDPPAGPVEAVDLEDAYAWLDQRDAELRDLPLQVTPVSLRAQPVALQAWRHGQAQLLFALNSGKQLTVYSLVDTQPGQPGAQALAGHLARQYPGHRVTVPQLQRPDLGGEALLRLGFQDQPLFQRLMRRPLRPAD